MTSAIDELWKVKGIRPALRIGDATSLRVLNHQPYEPIYVSGAAFDGVFLITTGMVKGIVEIGAETDVATLSLAGEMLGFDSFQVGRYVSTAVAVSAVETLWIPGEAFFELMRVSHSFRRQVEDSAAQALAESVLIKNMQTAASAEVRVAYFLLKLFSRTRDDRAAKSLTDHGLSRPEIARYLGLTESSVCSQLKAFHDAGFIALEGQKVAMHDRDSLRQICGPILIRF